MRWALLLLSTTLLLLLLLLVLRVLAVVMKLPSFRGAAFLLLLLPICRTKCLGIFALL